MRISCFEVQKQAESLAARIAQSDIVRRKKERVIDLFQKEAGYLLKSGPETLERAVDELVNAATLYAANSDPTRPIVLPMFSGPLVWDEYQIPGRRWGGDNPDNLYRFFPIDGESAYEITVRPGRRVPAQFSFVIWDTFMGERTKQATKGSDKILDIVIAALVDRDIQFEADRSFRITIDYNQASGLTNHMRSNADARVVLIRDSFSDWESQDPLDIQVVRMGGPAQPEPLEFDEMAQRAAHILWGVTPVLNWWWNSTEGFATARPNTMGTLYLRGGGWGFSCSGQFQINENNALVVTADALGAEYLGAVVWDPWTVSREHVHRTSSLNNTQAEQNSDGTFTYVVSAHDPGVRNWIDTENLYEGFFFLRWQALPPTLKSAEGAVRSVGLIPLIELLDRLPSHVTRFTPDMRKRQREERSRAIMHHYGCPPRTD